ncbi:hypothetical protein GY21_16740 [Cryobacterium roopkundense]|uniref:Uncharacterized protein n=1 Tax=Cryobacterium roopkundense TaxID=1001240 RepID=A0A099J1W1_9MICO|nr:hypothetical protein GY21_16740 [Cryobacterium roopkundense]
MLVPVVTDHADCDRLVVIKHFWVGRPLRDARDIAEQLTWRGVALGLDLLIYDPSEGRVLVSN